MSHTEDLKAACSTRPDVELDSALVKRSIAASSLLKGTLKQYLTSTARPTPDQAFVGFQYLQALVDCPTRMCQNEEGKMGLIKVRIQEMCGEWLSASRQIIWAHI